MNVWGGILKLFGWSVDITVPLRDKCVICVAPHTSNWDFIIGLLAYRSMGRKANFLMKGFWFFFPLKYLLKALGGIPVIRNKSANSKSESLTKSIINRFRNSEYLNLAVTPEGTRSRQPDWKTGFLYIASGADVPVELGVIDYKNKLVEIKKEIMITGNIQADMKTIQAFYSNYSHAAKFPDKFTIR